MTWKETAAVVTEPAVKEGVQLPLDTIRVGADDWASNRLQDRSWSQQHPKWHKALKWGGWALGAYAFDRVAHHNDWLWYHGQHDEGDTRNVTIIHEGDVTIICKGNCR